MAAMSSQMDPTYEELVNLFRQYDVRCNENKNKLKYDLGTVPFRKASVLIPLFYKDNELHVLLTVRTKQMPSHAGQVAFPGGMREPEDPDAIATAFREAHEEVGINRDECHVVAVLPEHGVKPHSLVSVVIALIPNNFKPVISPREVDLVFDLPLKRFLSGKDARTQTINFDSGMHFNAFHFYDKVDEAVVDTWGFTAHICVMTALVTYQRQRLVIGKETIHLENCFSTDTTQAIIDLWAMKAKL